MAKILILIAFMLSTIVSAEEEKIICPLLYASSVKKIVEASGDYDKFKHCAVSCLLALRCPALDVLEIGVLKELVDTAGPGNAEMADLEADYRGVALVVSSKAKSDKACIQQCHNLYQKNQCP